MDLIGNMTKIRVFEAFAGYGSQHLALKRLKMNFPNFDFEVVGISDIDKIQASGISNSQQYKMAGNSIVVDTLYHLFRKMFIDTGCEREGHQQTLF
jgi:site-specific DNA-cytosine methylase